MFRKMSSFFMKDTEDFELSGVSSVVTKGLRSNQVNQFARTVALFLKSGTECVLVDPDNLRLPTEGIVCTRCGFVQGEDAENCVYLGVEAPNWHLLESAFHSFLQKF